MNWKDVGKIVGRAAPVLGTALGGPAGGAIGAVVAGVLGVEDRPDAVAAAVAANPEAALKLKELYLNNEESVRRFELELLNSYLGDVQNARAMQNNAATQEDVFTKRFIYYLATFWSLMACLYIAFITFGTIPADNIRFADTCLGFILGTVVAAILQFFFGSSSGSDKKTEMQQTMIERLTHKD